MTRRRALRSGDRALGSLLLACAPVWVALSTFDAHADDGGSSAAPMLAPVDGAGPLQLGVPMGWDVRTQPPRRKDSSTIASMTARCVGKEVGDATIYVSLDANMSSPTAVLRDQWARAKTYAAGAWTCVDGSDHEIMCARRLPGLHGIVSVYLSASTAAWMQAAGGKDLERAVMNSVSWRGGAAAKIVEVSRDAVCPGAAPRP